MSDDDHRHYTTSETGSEWESPTWITDPLGDALGGFDLDPASGAERSPIADVCLTPEDDGLNTKWGQYAGDVYLNFPYSQELNPKWADKVAWELENGDIDTLTVLLPGSTSTDWYEEAYAKARFKTEIHKRISFYTPDDDNGEYNASFASIVHSFGEFPAEYRQALHNLGDQHPEDDDVRTTVWERRPEW